jgi:hypothetical protein
MSPGSTSSTEMATGVRFRSGAAFLSVAVSAAAVDVAVDVAVAAPVAAVFAVSAASSCNSVAVLGVSPMSALMASEVLPLDTASSVLPSCISAMMTPAVSK